MKIIFSLLAMISIMIACDEPVLVTPLIDNDGNEFDTINIGSQSWMQRNLNSAHYRNGDPVPKITNDSLWSTLTTGAWCWYNNDSVTYAAVYGRLYNWYAVNDPRGLAPEGWHVPTDVEWTTLETYLGGEYIAGGPMKEFGTTHWISPNIGATNLSGFTGLPGGSRFDSGLFVDLGSIGYLWSSTEDDTGGAWYSYLHYFDDNLYRSNYGIKRRGFSVRCLKD